MSIKKHRKILTIVMAVVIYSECEDYDACDEKLRATEVCKRWDETVKPWMEWSVRPPKVFDLVQQSEGPLQKD